MLQYSSLVQVDPPRIKQKVLHWEFGIEGDPADGAFAVRATADGHEDLLVCNFTGRLAEVAGVKTASPLALRRTANGKRTTDTQMRSSGD